MLKMTCLNALLSLFKNFREIYIFQKFKFTNLRKTIFYFIVVKKVSIIFNVYSTIIRQYELHLFLSSHVLPGNAMMGIKKTEITFFLFLTFRLIKFLYMSRDSFSLEIKR